MICLAGFALASVFLILLVFALKRCWRAFVEGYRESNRDYHRQLEDSVDLSGMTKPEH
jgi:hypothetical protein